MTTTAAPVVARPVREQSLYAQLSAEIRELGLLRRAYGYYWTKIIGAVTVLAALGTAFVVLGDTWWQLVLAAVLGIALTQTAFVGHDAAHRQIFASSRLNEWTSLIIVNLLLGMSHGWWTSKHSRHHANPNKVGKDPDIDRGLLAWTPEHSARRRSRVGSWLSARQGWLFFPVLLLLGLSLHISGIRALLGSRPMKRRRIELGMIALRLGGYATVVFVVLPPGKAALFLVIQLAAFGLYMGSAFAPNHKGMPILAAGSSLDFMHRQVLMSRNIRGGRFMDTFLGGLNYQIEHHLFPSMPRTSLRRAQPVVRAFCERHGITYTEKGLLTSYGIVIAYLNRVGLGASDPFVCPLVQQYRPRT